MENDLRVRYNNGDASSVSDLKKTLHNLRAALRRRLLTQGMQKRKHMECGGASIDLDLTAKHYRSMNSKHKAGLVTLICYGVITQQRLKHVNQTGQGMCNFCRGVQEDLRHVLWDCPRWGKWRTVSQEIAAAASTLPTAASLCGYALSSFSSDMKARWPIVQEQCAAVIEAHQEAQCKGIAAATLPVSNPGFQQELGGSEPVPAPVNEQEWRRGLSLPLRSVFSTATQTNPWIYSRAQFNQLMHWLAACRVAPAGVGVVQVNILECYMSYLLCSGMSRFQSGVPYLARGHWWTTQIQVFVRALRSAQFLALDKPLIPLRDQGAERCQWMRHWRVQPQLTVVYDGFMLPDHARVREELNMWSLLPVPDDPGASHGAELWRRQTIGLPDSQLLPNPVLATGALNWQWCCLATRRRMVQKQKPAPWQESHMMNKPFVAATVAAATRHGLPSIIPILREEGVETLAMISLVAGKRTKKAKLMRSLHAMNLKAAAAGTHIAKAEHVRYVCAKCGDSSSLSHVAQWFQKKCTAGVSGLDEMVTSVNGEIDRQIAELEREAGALRALVKAMH